MLSFNDMKKINKNVGTIGQQMKAMSDVVMQETFDNDLSTRQCYIYDYYHDDQADLEYGYNPSQSKTKIPVKLKFIVKSYKSMAKDDPEYHILFEPDVWNSMSCKPDWFIKNYERFGVEFPVGLYVDIPDDRGIYHRWMIMYLEVANQFVKCGVLRCNYRFKWITNDGVYRHKRKVWGVEATQNSYTSGVYTDYLMTRFEEQGKFYLPWFPIATELKHDSRLVISMLQYEPYVYQISKVKNTHPRGIITFTVKQDRFDTEKDYVQLNPDEPDYGDMYANYYSISIKNKDVEVLPEENDNFDCTKLNYEKHTLVIESVNDNVKLGAAKVLYAKIYDCENNDVTELYKDSKYSCDVIGIGFNNEENKLITDKEFLLNEYCNDNNELKYRFKCKFKFIGDELYCNDRINVICNIDNLSANILLDIVAL